jgi:ABC-type branched-subunit amino acid transport system ATPase component
MSPLLELDKVNAFYGRAHVLHGVSMEVERGERVALLGRNGVGKTTVVNSISGIATIGSGSIAFNGQSHSPLRHFHAARSGTAIVPQGRRIIPGLTIREHLQLGAAVNRKGEWTINSVCKLFPILEDRLEKRGTALSGGQQQMLAIGRALMGNPDLLVLDEPSEGLAPIIIDELGDTLVRLATLGMGILLIEQNMRLVRKLTDRFYIMSKGSIVETGSLGSLTAEVLQRHIAV